MTSKESSSKNKTKDVKIIRNTIVFIILFFFTINSLNIFLKDFFVDEVITIKLVQTLPLSELLKGVDVHYGYYILMKILPHNNIYLLRFYSLIITSLSIYILFVFSYSTFKNKSISFAVLLMCVFSQTLSDYSTQARMYPFLFFMSVILLKSFLERRYYLSMSVIVISIFLHYYSIFMLVPFLLTIYYNESRECFWKYLTRTVIVLLICSLILVPVVYRQMFTGNNPYKLNPPSEKQNIMSVPSMLIFPFIIPSNVNTAIEMILSFVMVFTIIYLVLSYNNKYLFLKISFITTLIIFISSVLLKIPYHHRYTIMFFPMVYLLLALSIVNKPVNIRYAIYALLIVFLIMTFVSYHINPEDTFIRYSREIQCPKNILHESPFSFLPMSVYLPYCNHYFVKDKDWKEVTYKTLYTTKDRINNYNVSYDVYIHYFDELKVPQILDKTNITSLRLIRIY